MSVKHTLYCSYECTREQASRHVTDILIASHLDATFYFGHGVWYDDGIGETFKDETIILEIVASEDKAIVNGMVLLIAMLKQVFNQKCLFHTRQEGIEFDLV